MHLYLKKYTTHKKKNYYFNYFQQINFQKYNKYILNTFQQYTIST